MAAGDQFYFYNPGDSAITVQVKKQQSSAPTISLQYSEDNETWKTWGDTALTVKTLSIPAKSRMYVRSTSGNAWSDGYYFNNFVFYYPVEAHGDIMTLLGYDTLKGYDCFYMFMSGSNLLTAPELPATTLATGCYSAMFYNCTSLTTAPELPATTLATGCYNYMFQGCTGLNFIKALFTTAPSNTYTQDWVNNVAAEGIFVKSDDATWNVTGTNGVPAGWTVYTESEWATSPDNPVYQTEMQRQENTYLNERGLRHFWGKLKEYIEAQIAEMENSGGGEFTETDPVFAASAAAGITQAMIEAWNGKQATLVSGTNIKTINSQSLLGSGNISISGDSGDTNVIETVKVNGTALTVDENKAVNISVPTKTSGLTNDSGFITTYTETDPVFVQSAAHGITSQDIANWNGKSTFSGSYNDLTDKPTIPAAQVQTDWSATSGMGAILNKPSIPTKTSDLTNDSGYITTAQVPTELPTVSASDAGKILCVNDSGAWVATSIAMQRYYTGSSEPAAAQGENGDLYLQTE